MLRFAATVTLGQMRPPGRRRYEKATDIGPKPFEAPFGTQGKQGKPALRSRRAA